MSDSNETRSPLAKSISASCVMAAICRYMINAAAETAISAINTLPNVILARIERDLFQLIPFPRARRGGNPHPGRW